MLVMLDGASKDEAMLYYLYMMSDGELSYSEKKLFDEICMDLNLGNDEKKEVAAKCKELVSCPTEAYEVIIREKLDEKAGKGFLGIGKNASSIARIVWNLINLGYADNVYSDKEKEIVNHLTTRWNVAPEIKREMIDTADTMLALAKQKEWIIKTFKSESERENKEKQVDTEMIKLLSDIKLTIEEITLVKQKEGIRKKDFTSENERENTDKEIDEEMMKRLSILSRNIKFTVEEAIYNMEMDRKNFFHG